MTSSFPNPFVRLFEAPVEVLTATAYALVLLTALLATWYALGRNLLWLSQRWQTGWRYLPSPMWVARAGGGLLVIAVDCLLLAGVVHLLT